MNIEPPSVGCVISGVLRPLRPRVTFVSAKVTKTILPRKASPASQVPSPLVGLRRCAYGASVRRMRTRGIPSAPRWAQLRPVLGVRLAYGAGKPPKFSESAVWAPYGAPAHRKPTAERLKGHARNRVGRTPAQGCAVGRPHSRRREAQGEVAPSGEAFLWDLSCRHKKGPRPRVREPDSNKAAGGDST